MKYKEILAKCAHILEPRIHDAEINTLLTEIEDCLANPEKEKIVIQMNGGLVQNVISETPMEILKIEEPGDSEDTDLITMYPDEGGSFYQEGAHDVYAGIFDAECNPDELKDTHERFERAMSEHVNQIDDDSLSMNPGQ